MSPLRFPLRLSLLFLRLLAGPGSVVCLVVSSVGCALFGVLFCARRSCDCMFAFVAVPVRWGFVFVGWLVLVSFSFALVVVVGFSGRMLSFQSAFLCGLFSDFCSPGPFWLGFLLDFSVLVVT
ncbi:hypothetical protein [Marinobacter sp. DSM 26671]|uniref:hypothetical protein n=1 Tax=Marinobacter sp. DSM 26671 TaxID=1761793 RepID=UPI001113A350|nr:hypothetical protein [Marinobacter sp. DSM 26671]